MKINYKRLSRTNYYIHPRLEQTDFSNLLTSNTDFTVDLRMCDPAYVQTHIHTLSTNSIGIGKFSEEVKVKKTVRDYPVDRSVNVDDTFGERIGQVAAVEDDSIYLLSLSPLSPLPLPTSAG